MKLTAIIFTVVLGGVMTNPTAVAGPDDKRAIQQLTADGNAAMRAKDIATLLTQVTEDVVFLPAGFPPIRGKQAVEAMYKAFFPQFGRIEQTAVLEEVEVAGDWAFAWGTETTTLAPQAGGSPIQMEGSGLCILKRQPDGSWKYARCLRNSTPRTVR